MNVLVTDGENRSALAVTRSLGRRGCDVFVAGLNARNISACSRFCKKNFVTPDPLTGGKIYFERIMNIVIKEKIDIIFPLTEQSIYQLNRARDQISQNVILACPYQEKMDAVSNKFELFRLAESIAVPVPKTIFVNGIEDLSKKEPMIPSFPAVVKPSFSRIAEGDRLISTSVTYASNRDEMWKLYETQPALRYPSIIQELIKGEGTGLFTLFDQSRHLVLFSHRRLLEKPPSGGVSVMSESVPLDPEMVDSAERLLDAIGWEGVAMVEFKRDVRDGKAKLMEINGRFWGSLQLSVSSGVDFPSLCLDYYLGKKPLALISDYDLNHRQKWLLGILDHLIIRLKKEHHNLPSDAPSRFQVAKEIFEIKAKNTSFDVYNSTDRHPFLTEVMSYIKTVGSRS